MTTTSRLKALLGLLLTLATSAASAAPRPESSSARTLRVFIFAGQSNMVGADSKAEDIERFPYFGGLDQPQEDVQFHYCMGRVNRKESDGWIALQPVDGAFGPELSFAPMVAEHTGDPVAIIKVATGGTTLGEDWNPDEPGGLKLYPRAQERVAEALKSLDRRRVKYTIEGLVWHQGENDMFDGAFKAAYAKNLANFFASWRRDLKLPELHVYVGELCTKTIWGMDHRMNMHAIAAAQRKVTDADPHATYVRTSHVGVEIGGGEGLHYHYGTLGQLQHGESHAEAYLARVGQLPKKSRPLKRWPYKKASKIKLFVLAGHRNMEGERAFALDLAGLRRGKKLAKDDVSIAYRYHLGAGIRASEDWEPLGPAGVSGTFGPELSFAAELDAGRAGSFAVAKFTDSGSQIIDWTPGGSEAAARHVYPTFIAWVKESIASLEAKGHEVELAGVFYHLSENDTAWRQYRREAAGRLAELVAASRKDLDLPELPWFVSQQEPADVGSVDGVDVFEAVQAASEADPYLTHVPVLDLPGRDEALVLTTPGVIELGRRLARSYLESPR